ncbi:MAG: hypothetical protein II520_04475 [Bacilli bacterium]|nr:hypothetical protein [Bacilli bacterium]
MKGIKEAVLKLGLNPQKELLWYVVFSLLFVIGGVGMWFLLGPSYYLLIPVFAWCVFTYFYLSRYSRMIKKKQDWMNEEFVRFFTFFSIFIHNGYNVYTALMELLPFSSDDMRERLERLLSSIESDKSVTPFVAFAEEYEDIAVKQVMVSIYQIVEEGGGDAYLRQFERLFGHFSDQSHQLIREAKANRLQTLGLMPLAGSAIAMIALSLVLMRIMEGSTYVL